MKQTPDKYGFKMNPNDELMRQGFRITFKNGNTVSVQWHFGNYCDNREGTSDHSVTAEVAVWDKDGNWKKLTEHDYVIAGYQTPEQVLALMQKYS